MKTMFNGAILLLMTCSIFSCSGNKQESASNNAPSKNADIKISLEDSVKSIFGESASVPGGEIISLTDNTLGNGSGSWQPSFSERTIYIKIDQKLISDTLITLQLISPIFLNVEVTKSALKATSYKLLCSRQAKKLIQVFPKLKDLRIETFLEKVNTSPEKRDEYGNITKPATQITSLQKANCTYISRQIIEKLNPEYFEMSDGSLRQRAQQYIEENISGTLSDHWMTENAEFKEVFCEQMYSSYCKALKPIVQNCD